MKRLGKDNIRQITENLERDLILKVLNSDIDFSNKIRFTSLSMALFSRMSQGN